MSNNNCQYYLFDGSIPYPREYFEFNQNNSKCKYKHLTINQFNEITTKYNLGSNWYPGEYDIITTLDRLI